MSHQGSNQPTRTPYLPLPETPTSSAKSVRFVLYMFTHQARIYFNNGHKSIERRRRTIYLSPLLVSKVKEHDAIVGEKGVLFGQLMKRNDELSLLYDKIRIQTSGLHQGEVCKSVAPLSLPGRPGPCACF